MKTLPSLFKARSAGHAAFAAWLAPACLAGLLCGLADASEAEALGAAVQNAAPAPGLGFNVKPEQAVAWARQRGVVDADTFKTLDSAAKARAFSIAGLTDEYALTTFRDSIATAIQEGQTANDWLNKIEDHFRAAGLSTADDLGAWHLRLIHRQNTSLALSAGRYVQMKQIAQRRPYWQYVATMDEGTRPSHAALNGVIKPHDDPFWSRFYPPWDYGCRCQVVSVSDDDLEAEGLEITNDDQIHQRYAQLAPGAGAFPQPREGFGFDPAKAFFLNEGPAGMAASPEGQAAYGAFFGAG